MNPLLSLIIFPLAKCKSNRSTPFPALLVTLHIFLKLSPLFHIFFTVSISFTFHLKSRFSSETPSKRRALTEKEENDLLNELKGSKYYLVVFIAIKN